MTVSVQSINDRPVAVDDTFEVAAGTRRAPLNVLANDSDPDSSLNPRSVQISDQPTTARRPSGRRRDRLLHGPGLRRHRHPRLIRWPTAAGSARTRPRSRSTSCTAERGVGHRPQRRAGCEEISVGASAASAPAAAAMPAPPVAAGRARASTSSWSPATSPELRGLRAAGGAGRGLSLRRAPPGRPWRAGGCARPWHRGRGAAGVSAGGRGRPARRGRADSPGCLGRAWAGIEPEHEADQPLDDDGVAVGAKRDGPLAGRARPPSRPGSGSRARGCPRSCAVLEGRQAPPRSMTYSIFSRGSSKRANSSSMACTVAAKSCWCCSVMPTICVAGRHGSTRGGKEERAHATGARGAASRRFAAGVMAPVRARPTWRSR